MKRLQLVLLVCFTLVAFSSSAAGETFYKTVKVDAKDNCCGNREKTRSECDRKSAKIELPRGAYIFRPIAGAASRHSSDREARMTKTEPWFWCVLIAVGEEEYVLGKNIKYKTAADAFADNKDDGVTVEIANPTTVHFWTEDFYLGKSACHDNRESMSIGIIKAQ